MLQSKRPLPALAAVLLTAILVGGDRVGVTGHIINETTRREGLIIEDNLVTDTALAAFWSGNSPTPTPHRTLVDAKVSVSGVCFRNVSGLRCCLGPYVEVADDIGISAFIRGTPPG